MQPFFLLVGGRAPPPDRLRSVGWGYRVAGMGVPKQMMVATAVVTVLYLWLPSFTHEQRWTDPVGEVLSPCGGFRVCKVD